MVFPSKFFDRIYVLKGGPGTGKSSFMKKISTALKEKKCQVDEIYCSSDPHSLDGVIAKNNEKKIAIIDGTAPHERDAIIPGAIDEIINLGDDWDNLWLTANKEKILSLANEKSLAYKTAYSYLKIAGGCDELIHNNYGSFFNKSKAKSKAEELFVDIYPLEENTSSIKLLSSFGLLGQHRLDVNKSQFSRYIGVGGEDHSALLLINFFADFLKAKGISFVRLPYPLIPEYNEGLYVWQYDLMILKDIFSDINADKFISDDKVNIERTKHAKELKTDALSEAQRWFSIASDIHFQLEDIYGIAMNFTKNDEIFDKKIIEISNILEL